jgi:hypothetical protein
MKSKESLKTVDPKAIDPAVLDKILGGIPVGTGGNGSDRVAVIVQARFDSFFHS